MERIDVWFEALTAKQALLFSTIIKELEKSDKKCLITTRKYDYIHSLLKMKNIQYISFGRYGGSTKKEKLEVSIIRMKKLLKFLQNTETKVHISFTSPDSTRVAYGLGIPIILLSDSPHSDIVNKLTIPLANKIIVPKCTRDKFQKYNIDAEIISFDGVFETIWTKLFRPNKKALGRIKPFSYAIVRLEEIKASYYPLKGKYTNMTYIIDYLLRKNVKIFIYPRYMDQREYIKKKYSKYLNKQVIIPKYARQLQSLEYFSLIVVTGGTSIAHEASLLGVPSITLFPKKLPITDYIIKKGFPLFSESNPENVLNLIHDILQNHDKYCIKQEKLDKLHEELEDPIPIIIKNIESFL